MEQVGPPNQGSAPGSLHWECQVLPVDHREVPKDGLSVCPSPVSGGGTHNALLPLDHMAQWNVPLLEGEQLYAFTVVSLVPRPVAETG